MAKEPEAISEVARVELNDGWRVTATVTNVPKAGPTGSARMEVELRFELTTNKGDASTLPSRCAVTMEQAALLVEMARVAQTRRDIG